MTLEGTLLTLGGGALWVTLRGTLVTLGGSLCDLGVRCGQLG